MTIVLDMCGRGGGSLLVECVGFGTGVCVIARFKTCF